MSNLNILVHGFNVKDPERSTGKLKPYLENPHMFNYGWRLFSVLWHNRVDAKRLAKLLYLNTGSNVWAHSNGCAIAVEAARRGAPIKNLICINPALKKDTIFPNSIERIIVIYTNHDVPTRAAAFFDKIPFLQLFVPNSWGAMGSKGPTSPDVRLKKLNFTQNLKGHSDFLEHEKLKALIPHVKRFII